MHNSSITCYLPIEIIMRELDAKVYLASQLVKKGFRCVLGAKTGVRFHMFSYRHPFVYFDKGLSPGKVDRFKRVAEQGGAVLEIREEGGVYNDMNNVLSGYQGNVLDYVQGVFVWGQEQKRILSEHLKKSSADKLVVAGYPSFDLLHRELVAYYKLLGNTAASPGERYVLINTNFAVYNGQLTFSEVKKVNSSCADMYNDELAQRFKEQAEYEETVFRHFVSMVLATAKQLPGTAFVLRPHPSEKLKTYLPFFEGCSNVHVCREGSIRMWIANAAAVIHHDCTSGIESFIMGKPTFSYLPVYNRLRVAFLPIEVSEAIKDRETLLARLSEILQGRCPGNTKLRSEKINKILPYIANIDTAASEKIIDYIECNKQSWFGRSINCNNAPAPGRQLFLKLYSEKVRFKKWLITQRNKTSIAGYQKTKFPGLKKADIVKRIRIWSELDKTLPAMTVRKIANDTFLLCRQ